MYRQAGQTITLERPRDPDRIRSDVPYEINGAPVSGVADLRDKIAALFHGQIVAFSSNGKANSNSCSGKSTEAACYPKPLFLGVPCHYSATKPKAASRSPGT